MTTNLRPTVDNLLCKISENGKSTQQMRPDGITGASLTSRPTKLPEGWHNTEKYGEVYISPGGTAWTIQRMGDELASVAVKLSPSDIIEKSAVEKRHDAILRQAKRVNIKVQRTKPPILTPSVVSKANDGVNEVNRKEG